MDKYLVVGRGVVGSIFSGAPQFDVVSHDEWHNLNLDSYTGMVCAAAMSTEAACKDATVEEVFEANVYLPLRILKHALSRQIRAWYSRRRVCIAFRTFTVKRIDVSPHNRYTASKVFMEARLQEESYSHLYIYRVPFVVLFSMHPNDFGERSKAWTYVEDVTASVVYRADIEHAIKTAMNGVGTGGIYNIASGSAHFPRFLEDRSGWEGDVVPAHSMGRTPNSIIDCEKRHAQIANRTMNNSAHFFAHRILPC